MRAFLILIILFSSVCRAEDFYVAQVAAGAGNGTNEANAYGVSFFTTSGNWGAGAGKISAGDTVHLCGTITTFLQALGSGSNGSPITIYFESGAILSRPADDLLWINAVSYIAVDGGTNGIIQNTANGSQLANQVSVKGINATGSNGCIIKNLTFQNLYVHTLASDSIIDIASGGGVYANGYGMMTIQNCTFSNIGWCINATAGSGDTLTVSGNSFSNYDHGVAASASAAAGVTTITNNNFGTTANWDTDANTYHHDGIHTFWNNGASMQNAVITANTFSGDWGTHNTAHIFLEQNFNTHDPSEAAGWLVANNVHLQYAGNFLNNGFAVLIGNSMTIANNTYLGASVALQTGVGFNGTNMVFKNNIVSGVNRFVDGNTVAASGLNTNLYAAVVGSGNTPFKYNGSNVASFAAWQTATGQDGSSSQVSSAGLDSSGLILVGSAAIGTGTDLSAYFTTDADGLTRSVPWDIGAYKYGGNTTFNITTANITTLHVQ